MVESTVYRIPAVDLITFCGVVAEDVLSPHGALLLSRDADFAALSPSKRRGFAFSLLNAGVSSVAVRERPELSLNEILEVMARGKRPPEQRFRNLYEDAMYYLTSFCEKVFSGGPGTLQSFTASRGKDARRSRRRRSRYSAAPGIRAQEGQSAALALDQRGAALGVSGAQDVPRQGDDGCFRRRGRTVARPWQDVYLRGNSEQAGGSFGKRVRNNTQTPARGGGCAAEVGRGG